MYQRKGSSFVNLYGLTVSSEEHVVYLYSVSYLKNTESLFTSISYTYNITPWRSA